MVVEIEMPWVRGNVADEGSARQRVRQACKMIMSLGQWPTLALIKDRVADVGDKVILNHRADLCRELGIIGKSGRVRVDLSLI